MLTDLRQSDLPPRTRTFWQMAGPGAVLVGLSIGAGEIIIWPRVVAEYGSGMIWAAIVGIFLQLWLNLEIGRWTIATGETVFTGYARVWRGFGLVFIVLTILGWIAPGWGLASGLALKALLVGIDGYGGGPFWTAVTFAVAALVLFGPRFAYVALERTVSALVVLITISLLVVAFKLGSSESLYELFVGATNFGYKHPEMSVKAFFIALVFAGAGGTANLFYCFYLRDKQIGMGARIPRMQAGFRAAADPDDATGYTFNDTKENRTKFGDWFRYVIADQVIFFYALNTFTILLFIFAALVVLHPRRIVPEEGQLIWDEAIMLGQLWGRAGRTLFLMVGVATLFSTQITLLDGCARTMSDIIYTNIKAAQTKSVGWWYLVIAVIWMISGVAITWLMERQGITDLGFLFQAAYIGGFAMAIYAPLQLYINHRYLPVSARPGWLCTTMGVLVSLVYITFAVFCLVTELM